MGSHTLKWRVPMKRFIPFLFLSVITVYTITRPDNGDFGRFFMPTVTGTALGGAFGGRKGAAYGALGGALVGTMSVASHNDSKRKRNKSASLKHLKKERRTVRREIAELETKIDAIEGGHTHESAKQLKSFKKQLDELYDQIDEIDEEIDELSSKRRRR